MKRLVKYSQSALLIYILISYAFFKKIANLLTGDEAYFVEINDLCIYNSQLTHGTNLNRLLINFIPEESTSSMEEVLHYLLH